jgi:methylmalonyl-CoA mutase
VSSTEQPGIADWEKLSAKEVKGRDLTWHTPEGIDVKPLYTAQDVTQDPGLPGFAPSRAACAPACMPVDPGRSGSTLASPPPRNPTPFTAAIWRRGRRASRWPSIWRRIAATTDHPRVVGDVGKAGVAIDSSRI